MKLTYQKPAIEVLNIKDTEVCEGVNYFNGVPVHKNCGGMSVGGSFKATSPDICTCDDES